MTRPEFLRHFFALDAAGVEIMWQLYLRVRDLSGARAEIIAALDRFAEQRDHDLFNTRQTVPDDNDNPFS